MYKHILVYLCIQAYVCKYVHLYVCIHVYLCLCMYCVCKQVLKCLFCLFTHNTATSTQHTHTHTHTHYGCFSGGGGEGGLSESVWYSWNDNGVGYVCVSNSSCSLAVNKWGMSQNNACVNYGCTWPYIVLGCNYCVWETLSSVVCGCYVCTAVAMVCVVSSPDAHAKIMQRAFCI